MAKALTLPNRASGFVGREKETKQLAGLYRDKKHVLVVGPAGIGKTALVRHVRQSCPLLYCEESSSLRRICDAIERQLGWSHRKLNVVERKNRLLAYLDRRAQAVSFDHVAETPPRVAHFIGTLGEHIPVWIIARSDQPDAIGRVWEHLYKFARVEVGRLTRADTRALTERAVHDRNIAPEVLDHVPRIHRISGGNPRTLEELFIELAARDYAIGSSFGVRLLELDRQIQRLTTDVAVAAA
ncbi:MAG: AAA family ATPase [Chthoniobacterales bacterium]